MKKAPKLTSKYLIETYGKTDLQGDIYESFSQSIPSTLARKQGELSVSHKNLKKYLNLANHIQDNYNGDTNGVEGVKDINRSPSTQLPDFLERLLQWQDQNGCWNRLTQVLIHLGIPKTVRLQFGSNSEQATAFVLATIRQHVAFFDFLHKAHDLGYSWLSNSLLSSLSSSNSTSKIIDMARDVIVYYTIPITCLTIEMSEDNSDNINTNNTNNNSNDNSVFPTSAVDPSNPCFLKSSSMNKLPQFQSNDDDHDSNDSSSNDDDNDNHVESNKNRFQPFPQENTEMLSKNLESVQRLQRMASKTMESLSSPSLSSPKPSTDTETPSVNNYSIDYVQNQIKYQENLLNDLKTKIISIYVEIESLVDQVYNCKDRCIKSFHKSITIADRNIQFDELTHRLGDGYVPILRSRYRPQPKLSSKSSQTEPMAWKRIGLPGLRPKIIEFFCYIQSLAEIRLELEEWKVYDIREKIIENKSLEYKINTHRWEFYWNDVNIVSQVIHCLDKLRLCRELYDWYGRSFHFLSNPLMLSFSMITAYESLGMDRQIKSQVTSGPFIRRCQSIDISNPEILYELHQWRDRFQDLCYRAKLANAPKYPDVFSDENARNMYVTIMVIFISYGTENLQESLQYEKKFIQLSETIRGSYLLEGKSAARKIHKPLEITLPIIPNSPSKTESTNYSSKDRKKSINSSISKGTVSRKNSIRLNTSPPVLSISIEYSNGVVVKQAEMMEESSSSSSSMLLSRSPNRSISRKGRKAMISTTPITASGTYTGTSNISISHIKRNS